MDINTQHTPKHATFSFIFIKKKHKNCFSFFSFVHTYFHPSIDINMKHFSGLTEGFLLLLCFLYIRLTCMRKQMLCETKTSKLEEKKKCFEKLRDNFWITSPLNKGDGCFFLRISSSFPQKKHLIWLIASCFVPTTSTIPENLFMNFYDNAISFGTKSVTRFFVCVLLSFKYTCNPFLYALI